MAEKDIAMSQKELRRLHFVRSALGKLITQKKASEEIGITERQVRRLVKRVREESDRGLIHRSRGRLSNRAISGIDRSRILDLYQTQYPDFGPTFACEKLFEKHKIKLSDETLRLWLIADEIDYKQRKKRPHRERRERKGHLGEMVQTDGSHHDWFEGRGPKCVLMGFIDDATGRPWGRFEPYEGTLPAFRSLKGYIARYGIPGSLYLDKHMAYRATKQQTLEDQLLGRRAMSQVERACAELGIKVIHADSPQAKGRVERLFRTLQDRLIKDLRLAKISSIEDGNRFLGHYFSRYYRKFGVAAVGKGDLHRPVAEGTDLDRILCIKTERFIRNDFTVMHEGRFYQVLENVRGKKVIVEERGDGTTLLRYRGIRLKYRLIETKPKKITPSASKYVFTFNKIRIPAADHPWKVSAKKFNEKEPVLTSS